MDLDQLREFVTYARYFNLSKAAAELNMAVSTLSRHVAALERELGSPLVKGAGTAEVSLTTAGAVVLEEAQEILYHRDLMHSRLERAAAGLIAPVTIAADENDRFIMDAMAHASMTLRREGSDVPLTLVHEQRGRSHPALLEEGACDIAVLSNAVAMDPDLYERILVRDDTFCVVLSKQCLDEDARSITVAQLARMRLMQPLCENTDSLDAHRRLFASAGETPNVMYVDVPSMEEFFARSFYQKYWICSRIHMSYYRSSMPASFFEENAVLPVTGAPDTRFLQHLVFKKDAPDAVRHAAELMGTWGRQKSRELCEPSAAGTP